MNRDKKNLRRLNTLVTAQTLGSLERLAGMAGYSNTGHVIDKLVRDHMLAIRLEHITKEEPK